MHNASAQPAAGHSRCYGPQDWTPGGHCRQLLVTKMFSSRVTLHPDDTATFRCLRQQSLRGHLVFRAVKQQATHCSATAGQFSIACVEPVQDLPQRCSKAGSDRWSRLSAMACRVSNSWALKHSSTARRCLPAFWYSRTALSSSPRCSRYSAVSSISRGVLCKLQRGALGQQQVLVWCSRSLTRLRVCSTGHTMRSVREGAHLTGLLSTQLLSCSVGSLSMYT